jgi:hypothetical protein
MLLRSGVATTYLKKGPACPVQTSLVSRSLTLRSAFFTGGQGGWQTAGPPCLDLCEFALKNVDVLAWGCRPSYRAAIDPL